MSELSKSENEIYSLRKEKEENIKSSNLESFATSFKNSTNINLLHQNHSNIEDGAKTDIKQSTGETALDYAKSDEMKTLVI